MMGKVTRRDWLRLAGLGAIAAVAGPKLCGAALAAPDEPAVRPAKSYELPPLPYPAGALAPQLVEELVRIHHEKHHAAYVRGLNDTLAKLEQARAGGDFANIRALSRDLAFHGSGHVLHVLYWLSMAPGGSAEPAGALGEAIRRDFGSFAAFRSQFAAAAREVEASGWAILAYEPLGSRLLVLQAERHEDLTIWGVVPLMVCDVWEHSYYLQYRNRRADYVESFMGLVDWPGVAKRYAAACRGYSA